MHSPSIDTGCTITFNFSIRHAYLYSLYSLMIVFCLLSLQYCIVENFCGKNAWQIRIVGSLVEKSSETFAIQFNVQWYRCLNANRWIRIVTHTTMVVVQYSRNSSPTAQVTICFVRNRACAACTARSHCC